MTLDGRGRSEVIDRVRLTRYTCDGCGREQFGELTDNVRGLMGSVAEYHNGGSSSGEWFACGRRCVGKAVAVSIDRTDNHDE